MEPAPQFGGRGFAAWYVPLEALVGVRIAARAAPAVVVLCFAVASALSFARGPPAARAWLALPATPLAFGWSFYMGFYPYCVSTALGLALLAAYLRVTDAAEQAKPRPAVTVGLFSRASSCTRCFTSWQR